MLLCPVCKHPLLPGNGVATCDNGHCFNRAKEGYLNLLRSSRPGDSTGDPKAAARSRRDFLNDGYYSVLRDALVAMVEELVTEPSTLLDICCGEGYYTSALGALPQVEAYGFDLSKEMVRLAAKRGGATYFVANMKDIPLASGSCALATCLFAPSHERETARILRPGGELLAVVPGAQHLWGLKEILYATPYANDEALPRTEFLELIDTRKVSSVIELRTPQAIEAVFQMTPYYYRTRPEDHRKLNQLSTLATPVEFVIARYRKPCD